MRHYSCDYMVWFEPVAAYVVRLCARGAAESLIRGQDNDVSLGWDTDNRRRAAVLCFDEVQVTDPFAAVALKGQLLLPLKT